MFELAQVDTAGSTLALLPLSVPGLAGGPAVDPEVVVKKRRKVTRVLQNDNEIAIILEGLLDAKEPFSYLFCYFHVTSLNMRRAERR